MYNNAILILVIKFILKSNLRHIIYEQKTLIVLNLNFYVITQLLNALKYLHNLKVIHRDI